MPNDLTKTIHFFEAFETIYQEPVRDTLQTDTTRTDTTSIAQDTTFQSQPDQTMDSIDQQDTLEVKIQEEQQEQPDSARIDSLVRQEDSTQEAVIRPEPQVQEPVQTQRETTDTLADLYQIFDVTELPISSQLENDPAFHNFLYNIPAVRPADSQKTTMIYQPTEKSLVTRKTTEVKQLEELPLKEKAQGEYDWMTYIIIFSFLLIGWSRLFFSKYFVALLKSFHSNNYASSLYYGKNSLTIRASALLNLTFFITGGAFLFQCMNHYDFSIPFLNPIQQLSLLSGFLLVWYIWNYLTSGFVGFVFLRQQSFREYFHNYNLYRKMAGISLFPVIAVFQYISVEYKPIIIYIGAAIFGILYFIHILRGFIVFIKKNVSIFYLILYLCALEFLPLVVLYEVFIRGL